MAFRSLFGGLWSLCGESLSGHGGVRSHYGGWREWIRFKAVWARETGILAPPPTVLAPEWSFFSRPSVSRGPDRPLKMELFR